MSPSACGGSVVSATGEALLQSIDAAAPNDSSRPLRSCTSRLSRGEKRYVSLRLHHVSLRLRRVSRISDWGGAATVD